MTSSLGDLLSFTPQYFIRNQSEIHEQHCEHCEMQRKWSKEMMSISPVAIVLHFSQLIEKECKCCMETKERIKCDEFPFPFPFFFDKQMRCMSYAHSVCLHATANSKVKDNNNNKTLQCLNLPLLLISSITCVLIMWWARCNMQLQSFQNVIISENKKWNKTIHTYTIAKGAVNADQMDWNWNEMKMLNASHCYQLSHCECFA